MSKANGTRSWRSIAAPAMLVAALLWLVVANGRPGAWAREISLATIHQSWQAPPSFIQIDELFGQQLPIGNIWLRFEGFEPSDEGMMTAVYYRGNYVVYPRRVYVADPATVVNNGQPMLGRDVLDDSLADRLGIHWTVTFYRRPEGGVEVKVDQV